jgi:hypothetical protein
VLTPAMPFWGLDAKQVDRLWVAAGFGLEAILFDGTELEGLNRLEQTLSNLTADNPLTLHFPMNNADYLRDRMVRDKLYAFLDLAHRLSARGVVLHSNCYVLVEDLASYDMNATRECLLSFLHDLDCRLTGSGLWVGVENMPLMGDLGDDVDAVFVYPCDFAHFCFRNIGVTVDIAHWMGALATTRRARELRVSAALLPPLHEYEPMDIRTLAPNVRHLHLSAVEGVALPFRRGELTTGLVPGVRGASESYEQVLRCFAVPARLISLEVAEDDYRDRRQLWTALNWLRQIGLVQE